MEPAAPRSYAVETGDVARDGREVLEIARREIPGFTDSHYSKYYEHNPLGPPALVVARDSASGRLVGSASMHPIELVAGGEPVLGGVAADFAVDRDRRVFGPALALQRALTAQAAERGFRYSIGLPNSDAAGVFARVGYIELVQGQRFVRLLTGRAVLEAARYRRGPIRDLASSLRPARVRAALRSYSTSSASGFDASFEPVWEAMHDRSELTLRRDAHTLNWRFEQRATADRFAISSISSRTGTVAAYSVSYAADGVRHIVDLGWSDPAALRAAVASEIERSRRDRLSAVDVLHFGSDAELAPSLASLGFFAVPGATISVAELANPPARLREREAWLLFEGSFDL
jgi:hypothetical protein